MDDRLKERLGKAQWEFIALVDTLTDEELQDTFSRLSNQSRVAAHKYSLFSIANFEDNFGQLNATMGSLYTLLLEADKRGIGLSHGHGEEDRA